MALVYLQVIKEQDWQPKSLKKLFICGKSVIMSDKFCTTPLCFFLQHSCPPPPSALS